MRKKTHRAPTFKPPYPPMMVMFAPTDRPMPSAAITTYLAKIYSALERIESDAGGSPRDWEDVSDCINFIDKCREKGWLADESVDLIASAAAAMRGVAAYHREHKRIHLVEADRPAVRGLLEDYVAMIDQMSARSYMEAFNGFVRDIYDVTVLGKKNSTITEVAFD